jgi:hypothetical protein
LNLFVSFQIIIPKVISKKPLEKCFIFSEKPGQGSRCLFSQRRSEGSMINFIHVEKLSSCHASEFRWAFKSFRGNMQASKVAANFIKGSLGGNVMGREKIRRERINAITVLFLFEARRKNQKNEANKAARRKYIRASIWK